MTGHRSYLNSLRGIAVIIIILFHFNFCAFLGGFVGVDIFFVISGFLVTSKIIKEIDQSCFSYAEFYANRIRRIFPALFILLVIVLIFEFFFSDYSKFMLSGGSVISISVFFSNLYYWHQSGYFNNNSIQNPLLHIWSLSIEEQFYLVLPVFIVASKYFAGEKFRVSLLVIGLLSFLLFCFGMRKFPDATFYFLPTRMWEFLVGSAIFTFSSDTKFKLNEANALSIKGFLILGLVIYLNYTKQLSLGGSIILSVLSSFAIIASGLNNHSLTNKLLNLKALQFTGNISYSLYLWHWPVYCFSRNINNEKLRIDQIVILFAITMLLAYSSWYFVENYFRKKRFWVGHRKTTYQVFLATSFFLLATGSVIYFNKGFPNRFIENQKLFVINKFTEKWIALQGVSNSNFQKGEMPIRIGSDSVSISFLIWGDSHAWCFASSLGDVMRSNNLAGYFLIKGGTPPLIGIYNKFEPDQSMLDFNNSVISFIEKNPGIRTVFLSARWAQYANGPYFDDGYLKKRFVYAQQDPYSVEQEDSVVISTALINTVKKLLALQRKVVIITPVPEQKYNVCQYYINQRFHLIFGTSPHISPLTTKEYDLRTHSVNQTFTALSKLPNVTVLEIDKLFRRGNQYLTIFQNNPLYTDNNHLSYYGLLFTAPVFQDYFKLTAAAH